MVRAYLLFVRFITSGNAVSQRLETLSQTHNVTRLALFDQFTRIPITWSAASC